MSSKFSEDFKTQEVEAFKTSGLSMEKFCQDKSYSPKTLHNWKQKFSKFQTHTFAPVKVSSSLPVGQPKPTLPEPEWLARFLSELLRSES